MEKPVDAQNSTIVRISISIRTKDNDNLNEIVSLRSKRGKRTNVSEIVRDGIKAVLRSERRKTSRG